MCIRDRAQYLALNGMTQLIQSINKVKRQISPNLKVEGALITMADINTCLLYTSRCV